MGLLRRGDTDQRLIREVMESAEYVWERQRENSRKKDTTPALRWRVIYQESQYYCGLQPLSYLLTQLEKMYMDCGREDFPRRVCTAIFSYPPYTAIICSIILSTRRGKGISCAT